MHRLYCHKANLFGWLTILYAFFVPTIKPVEAVLAVLLIVLAAGAVVTEQGLERQFGIYGLLLLLYLAADSLSLLVNGTSAAAGMFLIKNATLFSGFAVAVAVKDTRFLYMALVSFCLGVCLLAGWTVLEAALLGALRPPGIMNPVHAGYVLSFGTLVAVVMLMYMQTRPFWMLLPLVLLISGLMINATRGAWVATAVALLPLVLRTGKKRFLVLICAGLTVLVLFVPSVHERTANDIRAIMDSDYRAQVETSIGTKIDMWLISLEMFRNSPLLGVGNSNWQTELYRFVDQKHAPVIIGRFNQAHNMFIHTLAVSGITGFSALILLLSYPFYFVKKYAAERSLFSDLLITVSIAFIIQGIFDSVSLLYRPLHCYLFLTGVSLSGIIPHIKESKLAFK